MNDSLNKSRKRILSVTDCYSKVIMCSICAAVQGMDETANNGAQVFYLKV